MSAFNTPAITTEVDRTLGLRRITKAELIVSLHKAGRTVREITRAVETTTNYVLLVLRNNDLKANWGVREGKGRGWHGDAEGHARAGRKGGSTVVARHGVEHMSAIGQKGGATVSEDREHMAAIGSIGGRKVAQDREHMAAIGSKGGTTKQANWR